MDGGVILFLVVFNLVMLGWLVAGLWALSKAPANGFLAQVGAGLVDTWRAVVADIATSHLGTFYRWLRPRGRHRG